MHWRIVTFDFMCHTNTLTYLLTYLHMHKDLINSLILTDNIQILTGAKVNTEKLCPEVV